MKMLRVCAGIPHTTRAGSITTAPTKVSELRLPRESLIVTIARGDRVLVASGDTELRPGDQVLAAATTSNATDVCALFGVAEPML